MIGSSCEMAYKLLCYIFFSFHWPNDKHRSCISFRSCAFSRCCLKSYFPRKEIINSFYFSSSPKDFLAKLRLSSRMKCTYASVWQVRQKKSVCRNHVICSNGWGSDKLISRKKWRKNRTQFWGLEITMRKSNELKVVAWSDESWIHSQEPHPGPFEVMSPRFIYNKSHPTFWKNTSSFSFGARVLLEHVRHNKCARNHQDRVKTYVFL